MSIRTLGRKIKFDATGNFAPLPRIYQCHEPILWPANDRTKAPDLASVAAFAKAAQGPIYIDADHLDWTVFGLPKKDQPVDEAWAAGVDRYGNTIADICQAARDNTTDPIIVYNRVGWGCTAARNVTMNRWWVAQSLPTAQIDLTLRRNARLRDSFDYVAWSMYWSWLGGGNVELGTSMSAADAYKFTLDFIIEQASAWGKPMLVFTMGDEPPEVKKIISHERRVKWAYFKV